MFTIVVRTLSILISFLFGATFSSILPIPAYASFNESCNGTFACEPNTLLTCTAGICQCESPSNQIYIKSSNICHSSVGGQCTLENSTDTETQRHPCIKNAQCVTFYASLSTTYTECQCKEGFIENASGSCVPGIGQPCTYGPEECNPLGMVVCKNSRCQCYDKLQVYDKEVRRCVSPAGTHCKYDSLQLGCVKNAICYPFYYWIPPRCLCKPGYVQTANRTCVSQFSDTSRGLAAEDL